MSHPLHPALVHFPIACWSLGSAADLASHWFPVGESAALLHAGGTLIAVPVMLSGLLDSRRVGESGKAAGVLTLHMTCVFLAWLAYALSLALRWDGGRFLSPGAFALALSGAGFLSLLAAGWFGGQLVYTHGVGVSKVREGTG